MYYGLSSLDGGAEGFGTFELRLLYKSVVEIFDKAQVNNPEWYKETMGLWTR